MKDNWTPNDFSKSSHYAIRIKELQDELKNKVKCTNIERYGVENVFASDIVKDRIINNNVKKYGVDHYSKTDKGRKKLSECAKNSLYKRCTTCKERYGVDYALANSDIA